MKYVLKKLKHGSTLSRDPEERNIFIKTKLWLYWYLEPPMYFNGLELHLFFCTFLYLAQTYIGRYEGVIKKKWGMLFSTKRKFGENFAYSFQVLRNYKSSSQVMIWMSQQNEIFVYTFFFSFSRTEHHSTVFHFKLLHGFTATRWSECSH